MAVEILTELIGSMSQIISIFRIIKPYVQ